jgi:hypothetical protein
LRKLLGGGAIEVENGKLRPLRGERACDRCTDAGGPACHDNDFVCDVQNLISARPALIKGILTNQNQTK